MLDMYVLPNAVCHRSQFQRTIVHSFFLFKQIFLVGTGLASRDPPLSFSNGQQGKIGGITALEPALKTFSSSRLSRRDHPNFPRHAAASPLLGYVISYSAKRELERGQSRSAAEVRS
jgi:hypothetical protein